VEGHLTAGSGKDTGQESPDHAAHAMQLEHIHALVNIKPRVNVLHRRASSTSQKANDHRDPRGDVAGGRGDSYKASNGALAGTNDTEPALVPDVVDQNPAENTGRGSGVGVEDNEQRAHRDAKSRAAVEAKPAEPYKHSAEENERDVVRLLVVGLGAMDLSLSEHKGICQRTAARSDMHGAATGEIKRGQVVEPPVGVPCPACDGAVDDGGPEETEDDGRNDAAALKRTTNHDLHRASANSMSIVWPFPTAKIMRLTRRAAGKSRKEYPEGRHCQSTGQP